MDHSQPEIAARHTYWIYPVFIVIAVPFLLVFSGSTSPLYNFLGIDSSIFVLMGEMFLDGKTPYVDFFDHKGPVLIFIEALGLAPFAGNQIGIFVLQVINLVIIQALIFYIANKFTSALNSISIIFLCLLMFSLSIGEGNLTEEYSLPFALASLLFTVQYQLSDKQRFFFWKFIVIGIGIAALFWMRINNMGVICACVVYIFLVSLKRKDWQMLRRSILGILTGFLLITVPLALYFLYKDALYEMIYATFIFNMKYVGYEPELSFPLRAILLYIAKYWSVFIILIIGTILYCRQRKEWSMLLLAFLLIVFGLVGTRFGLYVTHYMTLNIPLLVLGLSLLVSALGSYFSRRKVAWMGLVISLLLLSGYTLWKYNNAYYRDSLDDSAFISQSLDISSHIPASERESVYPYNVQGRFFLNTGIKPRFRYFIFQEWHGVHDSQIFEDVNKMMSIDPPSWVVIATDNTKEQGYVPNNPRFFEILNKDYTLFHKNDGFILYKKN